MSTVLDSFATQAGHFYKPDGTPAYEVIGANGKQRATTVRDAKKHGLLPSVTTVLKLLDKPGLTNWLIDQAILAALTLPRQEGESEKDWLDRVKRDAKETGIKAADRGTQIHGAIERVYKGDKPTEWEVHAYGAVAEVQKATGFGVHGWAAEKSAAHPIGFGVKTDLIREGWTVDFKSKEFDADTELKTYDEHAIQLQANSAAHGMPNNRSGICYVSATVPGLARFIEVERDELDRGWAMFTALLSLWMAKNKYDPRH